MTHAKLGLAAIGLTIVLFAPSALAGHGGPPVVSHRTYEVGPTYVEWECLGGIPALATGSCDPTGTLQDGSIDIGGARFYPDEVPAGVNEIQSSTVDDVWGAGVVASYLGTDENGNNVVGETDQGETQMIYCGTSPTVTIPPAPNWDVVVVFVSFPGWAVTNCDPTAAPSATSGGVLDPAGGIYTTFS